MCCCQECRNRLPAATHLLIRNRHIYFLYFLGDNFDINWRIAVILLIIILYWNLLNSNLILTHIHGLILKRTPVRHWLLLLNFDLFWFTSMNQLSCSWLYIPLHELSKYNHYKQCIYNSPFTTWILVFVKQNSSEVIAIFPYDMFFKG